LVQIPVRWRDLPRDAYLSFEVLGHCDEVVREDSSDFPLRIRQLTLLSLELVVRSYTRTF
jgi:hypothetical protein